MSAKPPHQEKYGLTNDRDADRRTVSFEEFDSPVMEERELASNIEIIEEIPGPTV